MSNHNQIQPIIRYELGALYSVKDIENSLSPEMIEELAQYGLQELHGFFLGENILAAIKNTIDSNFNLGSKTPTALAIDSHSTIADKQILTVQECADYLGVSDSTIRRRIKEGAIKSVKSNASEYGHIKILKSDIKEYLNKGKYREHTSKGKRQVVDQMA